MRFSRAALVLVVMPLALAAQQPAPTTNPITAVVKQRTMAYQQRLAQAFDSIPERLFSYKPTPAQLTIGYIAQHLASDNNYYCSQFGAMKPTRTAEETSMGFVFSRSATLRTLPAPESTPPRDVLLAAR